MAEHTLTREGYDNLQRELDSLQNDTLAELQQQLIDIKNENDNNEEDMQFFYTQSRMDYVNERIRLLQYILANATVLDGDPDPATASPGDHVRVQDMDTHDELVFHLVDGAEVVNNREGVALDSPVGKALLGKHIGDVITVEIPDGKVYYKLIGFEDQS
ncbi:MAG: transcription elongation factor GreA [Anaerolineae bacterium]